MTLPEGARPNEEKEKSSKLQIPSSKEKGERNKAE